jgi:uncharacterized membrane protein YhaH (DUF805 family)
MPRVEQWYAVLQLWHSPLSHLLNQLISCLQCHLCTLVPLLMLLCHDSNEFGENCIRRHVWRQYQLCTRGRLQLPPRWQCWRSKLCCLLHLLQLLVLLLPLLLVLLLHPQQLLHRRREHLHGAGCACGCWCCRWCCACFSCCFSCCFS